MNKELRFVFFGTPPFAAGILEELKERGFVPVAVVAAPARPRGRKLVITPPESKVWAVANNVPVLQPEKMKDPSFLDELRKTNADLFVVAAYGKLIPKEILEMPAHGTINVHPSLLPRLRGASPIQSAILFEDKTGTTIMKVDEEMDHGDILAQEELNGLEWPPRESVLESALIKQSGQLLAETMPKYVSGEITSVPQDHAKATFTKKIEKEDGLIDPEGSPMENYRKFCAFEKWPRTYFFKNISGKQTRIIITDAALENGKFIIKKVLPENMKEMAWEEFLKKT